MKLVFLAAFTFLVNVAFGQVGNYEKITPADFERTTPQGIGQHTKVYFKYLPLKSTTLEADIGNNFFWFTQVEKQGKVFLNDHLLKNGFTLAINRKMEDMNTIRAVIYQLVDGKIETVKLSKKLIERKEDGDTTYYHFRFDGYTNRDICEISYTTKTEFKKNLLVIRMNEISTLHRAKADIIIPEYLQFTLRLIGIDDRLTQEETIFESAKARTAVTYQSKKSTYYVNSSFPDIRPQIIATAMYVRKP
jgi:hypothetical protein